MGFWVTESEQVGGRYFIFAEVEGVIVEKQVEVLNSIISSRCNLTSQEKEWFMKNVVKTKKSSDQGKFYELSLMNRKAS